MKSRYERLIAEIQQDLKERHSFELSALHKNLSALEDENQKLKKILKYKDQMDKVTRKASDCI